MYGTVEHTAFVSARCRCKNLKDSRYGGRGIKFLFPNFNLWFFCLGPRPSPKHSVDRINNDGHYEPGNVRWATAKEQRQNQRLLSREQLMVRMRKMWANNPYHQNLVHQNRIPDIFPPWVAQLREVQMQRSI